MDARFEGELVVRDSPAEEWVSAVTHGIGLVLGTVGLGALITLGALRGDPGRLAGGLVFGVTLVFLYAASTLYHSARQPRLKYIWRTVDHIAIYYLIAGTYTPVLLTFFEGGWQWALLAAVWTLALAGTVYKLFFIGRHPRFSLAVYLGMGWLWIVALEPMLALVPPGGLAGLAAGGLFYTLGVVFYAWRRLPYNHAIWHLFVLAGSGCHYAVVAYYVLVL